MEMDSYESDQVYANMDSYESDQVYANMDIKQSQSRRAGKQQRESAAPVDSSDSPAASCGWAVWLLIALSCLLLAGSVALGVLFYNLQTKNLELQSQYSELERNYTDISATVYNLQAKNLELQSQYSELERNYTDISATVCEACLQNWELFNGKCYYFSTDKKDWHSSRDNCTSLGGHLVIIESEAEQEFIQSQVRRIGDFFWIGLSDAVTEGEFLWVDNTRPSTTYWKHNEPNNGLSLDGKRHSNADCAVIDYRAASLQSWGDTLCSVPVRWVCETISAIPAG